jgi:hypothetical protein
LGAPGAGHARQPGLPGADLRPRRSICLDLTFAILPPIDGPYATLDLIADRYVLLAPAGLPLAEAGVRPDAAALERTPMIGSQWERRTIDALAA